MFNQKIRPCSSLDIVFLFKGFWTQETEGWKKSPPLWKTNWANCDDQTIIRV